MSPVAFAIAAALADALTTTLAVALARCIGPLPSQLLLLSPVTVAIAAALAVTDRLGLACPSDQGTRCDALQTTAC